MSEQLLSPTFLFRFAAPLLYKKSLWTKQGTNLGPEHRLASFGQLEGQPQFAEIRGGWNGEGLAFWVEVRGKEQSVWCRESRPEESDGLHLWIDTRDTHNIHRASRFCHRYVVLPQGAGVGKAQPLAALLPINRAKESPKPPAGGTIKVHSTATAGGYAVGVYLPSAALTGYDPAEHPKIGFSYMVLDRELGEQTFAVGKEFPIAEDPSLWGTLELARPE